MTFNNRGRIRPAAGPEGHTHSIYQLNDVSAASVDFQSLVSSNGVWVAQTVAPYAMASGRANVTLTSGSPWSTGTVTVDLTAAPWNSPFTVTPTVIVSPGPTGTTGPLVAQYTANSTGITIRLSYYGASGSTIAVSWVAVQMQSNSAYGSTSIDPSNL